MSFGEGVFMWYYYTIIDFSAGVHDVISLAPDPIFLHVLLTRIMKGHKS